MKNVFDISDLQRIAPIFNNPIGKWIGKKIIRLLGVQKVNQVHANHAHLRGAEFTSALLQDPLIDVKYKIHNAEILEHLPEGAFVTVSNHPIGSLDGIILIDIFAKLRSDFKVMVNGFLNNIWAMRDNFVSVVPDSEKKGANLSNVNGVRESLCRLKEGHPMGFFPAGAISFKDKKTKEIEDLSWARSVIRLVRRASVPVYPVYFECYNSNFFYNLAYISWKIRVFRIPAEAFNKQGKTVHVYIGNPISPEELSSFKNDAELALFLRNSTLNAKNI